MNNEFKVGDIVALKSGSPDMTIEQFPFINNGGYEVNTKAKCVWFSAGEVKRDVFPIDALDKQ